MKIKRALISVSDKTGVADFARELEKQGVEIISTGGHRESAAAGGNQDARYFQFHRISRKCSMAG